MSTQDYRQVLKSYTTNANLDAPLYHCQQDSISLPCNYYCSLVVCGRTFSTVNAYPSKNSAESQAAELACKHLNLIATNNFANNMPFLSDNFYDGAYSTEPQQNHNNFGVYNAQPSVHKQSYNRSSPYPPNILNKNTNPSKNLPYNNKNSTFVGSYMPKQPKQNANASVRELRHYLKNLPVDTTTKVTDTSPIPVGSIADVWKYMHGEVLANFLKSFLALVYREEHVQPPVYTKRKIEEKLQHMNLYQGECQFKGQTFSSIGKNIIFSPFFH